MSNQDEVRTIYELWAQAECLKEEIEELKAMIQEATPWLMNNKYLPYNEIKSWLEKADKIK